MSATKKAAVHYSPARSAWDAGRVRAIRCRSVDVIISDERVTQDRANVTCKRCLAVLARHRVPLSLAAREAKR